MKGEDVVRESGIPSTIIRPCALTEEPSGAPMIVGQGDNIKGKISRRVGALLFVVGGDWAAGLDRPCLLQSFKRGSTSKLSTPQWIADPRDRICLYSELAPLSICLLPVIVCLDRDDIAELAVESLLTPEASGLTFEVKSDLAFSTLWEGAPEGDADRNYG